MVRITKSAPATHGRLLQDEDADGTGIEDEHAELPSAALAVILLVEDRIERQARSGLWREHGHKEDVERIEQRQDKARHEGAFVHVTDRAAELVGHDDQHQRGRDDLRESPRGGDHAGCDAAVIAVAQHDRQRDQAHRDDGCRHDTSGCRQKCADEDHRIGKTTFDGTEQLPDRVEQVFRHAGALENKAHEGEERDRQQRLVVHYAEDALGKSLQEVRLEQSEFDADDGEEQAVGGECEGDRIAEQQEEHEGDEHDRGHVLTQEAADTAGCESRLGREREDQKRCAECGSRAREDAR